MREGRIDVEQVGGDGRIVFGKDQSSTPAELRAAASEVFDITGAEDGALVGTFRGKPFALYLRNVTYLGRPHPRFKKRIQIGDAFPHLHERLRARGIPLLLVGVYRHGGLTLFVDFGTENYVANKAHNSSAHVFTSDLQKGLREGIAAKTDANGNRVTVFTPAAAEVFLAGKLCGAGGVGAGAAGRAEAERQRVFAFLDGFFESLPRTWDGIACYREMIDAGYRGAYQPEWPGWYLEFRLQRCLEACEAADMAAPVAFHQDQTDGGIDLDLRFPGLGAFGDLKCHSVSSSEIIGNDGGTVMRVVGEGPLYYVVLNHTTVKDSDMGLATTRFWNSALNSRPGARRVKPLDSYGTRMKGRVGLVGYQVLEISDLNVRYLAAFQQGFANSNGKPRESKIAIRKSDIPYFIVHDHPLA